jgi:tRNA nucleotidyltransferase (CCA-adding enzyme)
MAARGYLPVGRDFPVFLHPETREEHALARTERKSAPGYRGFVVHAEPGVTLEEDLARRDLTINAMALPEALATGARRSRPRSPDRPLRRPWRLAGTQLRHVTDAFREDPVRILRLARFAARFSDFTVAPETVALMRPWWRQVKWMRWCPTRVWQELLAG